VSFNIFQCVEDRESAGTLHDSVDLQSGRCVRLNYLSISWLPVYVGRSWPLLLFFFQVPALSG